MLSGVWSQASDLQVRRDETVLTNVGGRVLAIAGYDNKEYWQHLEEFQPRLNRSVVPLSHSAVRSGINPLSDSGHWTYLIQ